MNEIEPLVEDMRRPLLITRCFKLAASAFCC